MATSERKDFTISRTQKLKVLGKLIDSGCRSESDLKSLDMEQILRIKNISIADIVIVIDFQKHIKSNTFYSYIAQDAELPCE